jgi:hypothetical protein
MSIGGQGSRQGRAEDIAAKPRIGILVRFQ